MTAPPALRVTLVGLVAAGRSGVPRYAQALTKALDEVAGEFGGLELSLLTTPSVAKRLELTTLAPRLSRPRRGSSASRVLAEQLAAARAPRADLLHFFDLSGPTLAPWRRFTTTAHDVRIAHGFGRTATRKTYRRLLQPWAARHAAGVVAVSRFTADELIRHFGARPDRVHVIHSGPGLVGEPTSRPSVSVPTEPFLLYVGGFAANKNLPLLIRAFGHAPVGARLLLVGDPAEGYPELLAAVAESPARDRISIVTETSDADVGLLYRRAVALALPSLYEGFGFTPLEAMKRDCPVLASDIPALREVSRDGGFLLPASSEREWGEAISRIFRDEGLRESLRARGREVASGYSWRETARSLCRLFLALEGRGVWATAASAPPQV